MAASSNALAVAVSAFARDSDPRAERRARVVALTRYGLERQAAGDLQAAAEAFRGVTEMMPGLPLAWNNLALALTTLGDPDAAVTALRCSLSLDPDQPRAWSSLASAHLQLGRIPEADSACAEALHRDPCDAAAWQIRAAARAGREDFAGAAEAFARALDIAGESAPLRASLGAMLFRCGRFEEAATHLETALALDPTATATAEMVQLSRFILGLLRGAMDGVGLSPSGPGVDRVFETARLYVDERGQAEAARRVAEDWAALRPDDVLFAALPSNALADTGTTAVNADTTEALAEAMGWLQGGETVRAETLFRAVLDQDPANAEANHQLGLLALAQGDAHTAQAHLRRATASNPWEPELHNNLGVALNALGLPAAARTAFEAAIALKPDFAQAVNNLGAALAAVGEEVAAIQAYRRALEIDPAYVEARDNLDLACGKAAPAWHFPMMADAERNDAYDQALRRAAPGRRVLDIGTGSGLLSMMAVRAGAASVATCEAVLPIADAARRVIAANGFSSQIAVHAKHSDQLQVGTDIGARADLLVTETFASGVLSEGVLPALEHARRHLLTPEAQVIPCRAVARGYLVGGEAIEGHFFAPGSTGFDLSAFDLFAPGKVGLHLDRVRHDVLSDDFEILAFDLTQSSFPAERRDLSVTAIRSGRCLGVAQWLRLGLDAETTYENRPRDDAGANGWMHVLYRFPAPLDLKAGDQVRLVASHNRTSIAVALAG